MLQLFPFFAWLAIATSASLLVMLLATGDLGPRAAAGLAIWCLAAGYCQFRGSSPVIVAAGLGFQTVLAVALIVRWRLSA